MHHRNTLRAAVVVVLVALLSTTLLLAGCGEDKAVMQAFVDGYLQIMETLESKPEVAQAGREASIKYAGSGYTDLDSARAAEESFTESSRNDQAAMEELKALDRPDEDAEKIAGDLEAGVIRVNEGNKMFASSYAMAPGQSVEERAATAENIEPALKVYSEGMGTIVVSLSALVDYIDEHGLDGEDEAVKWRDRIEGEKKGVDAYISR